MRGSEANSPRGPEGNLPPCLPWWRARSWRRGCAAALIVTLPIGCDRGDRSRSDERLRSGALARSNVLLITIDTLRADRVGAYGGGTLTPTLDRLSARGVRFTRAHAHVPLTLPAHTSILTGLVPATHGVHNNGASGLAADVPTLASILHDAGYRTGAFVGAFVLDARFGLSRGFDVYDDRVGSETGPVTFAFAERTADRVTQLAGDWILSGDRGLETGSSGHANRRPDPSTSPSPQPPAPSNQQRTTPWFCWIHLFDPHAPYRAPEQRAADPYDNEVAFADAQLGRLIERLRTAGLLESTLIVALADHGESLRSEEHTSELQSRRDLVCRLLLEKKKIKIKLSPADLRKQGGMFNLAIALGILSASGHGDPQQMDGMTAFGELTLDGTPIPVPCAL